MREAINVHNAWDRNGLVYFKAPCICCLQSIEAAKVKLHYITSLLHQHRDQYTVASPSNAQSQRKSDGRFQLLSHHPCSLANVLRSNRRLAQDLSLFILASVFRNYWAFLESFPKSTRHALDTARLTEGSFSTVVNNQINQLWGLGLD